MPAPAFVPGPLADKNLLGEPGSGKAPPLDAPLTRVQNICLQSGTGSQPTQHQWFWVCKFLLRLSWPSPPVQKACFLVSRCRSFQSWQQFAEMVGPFRTCRPVSAVWYLFPGAPESRAGPASIEATASEPIAMAGPVEAEGVTAEAKDPLSSQDIVAPAKSDPVPATAKSAPAPSSAKYATGSAPATAKSTTAPLKSATVPAKPTAAVVEFAPGVRGGVLVAERRGCSSSRDPCRSIPPLEDPPVDGDRGTALGNQGIAGECREAGGT